MRVGLVIGGLVLIAAGLVIGFGFLNTSEASATDRVREPIQTIAVDNASGDIDIRVADTDTTTVRQRFEYRWDEPTSGYSVDGDVLTLGDCGANCSVDYELTVPRAVELRGKLDSGSLRAAGLRGADLEVQSGNIDLSDVAGAVTLSANSGTIALARVDGEMDLEASSGDITGRALNGPVQADVSSGRMQLDLASAQDVQAELSSGDLDLTVPRGSYAVRSDASSGNVDVRVPNDPNGGHSLDLSTSSGSIAARTK